MSRAPHDAWTLFGSIVERERPAMPVEATAVVAPVNARPSRGLLVEARLPGVSEPVSAIALGGFRSLVRSPEAKMMLLSPVIMIPIFGSMLWRGRAEFRKPFGRSSPSVAWWSCSSA